MPKKIRTEIPELPKYGLRNIFGDTVRARILDFLTLYRGSAYSMSEIARNSHVSWRQFNREFPYIVSLGIVKEAGTSGRAKLYEYANPENPLTECLIKMANQVAIQAALKETEKLSYTE